MGKNRVPNPSLNASRTGAVTSHMDFTRRGKKLEQTTLIIGNVNKGPLTSTSASEGLYSFSFTLADVADYTNYVSVWDQYKIVGVDIVILPVTNLSPAGTSPAYAFLYIAPDYDDATAPANSTTMLSYSSLAVVGPCEKYSFTIRPSVDIATTTSAASAITGSMAIESPWIDCSESDVTHYGIKAAVTQSTSTNLTAWNMFCRYRIQFRRQQ